MISSNKPVVILGSGLFADRMRYHFEKDGGRRVVAFAAERAFIDATEHDGLPCVPFESVAVQFPPSEFELFVAVGYSGQNRHRSRLIAAAETLGYTLPNYVSPWSKAEEVILHGNCVLLSDAVVGYACTLGKGVILGPNVVLTHHCTVERCCYLGASVSVAGATTLRERVFCGIGSTIIDSVDVAPGTFICAGSVVRKSITRSGMYEGNPARFVRKLPDAAS